MNRISKRSIGLAVILMLALVATWADEVLVRHDHDNLHPDPGCAVCRAVGNPAPGPSSDVQLIGIPRIDSRMAPPPLILIPASIRAFLSPVTRAPPIA